MSHDSSIGKTGAKLDRRSRESAPDASMGENGLFATPPQGPVPGLGPNGGEIAAVWINDEDLFRCFKTWIVNLYLVLYMYSTVMEFAMLALRLPPELEKRLDSLAKKTGRSKSFYAREAILRHLEDLEDYHLARRRLARKATRVTLEELERELTETR
jgi:RHH-type transcriptional regulator, rel operon repressor / antitoxin RelB